MTKKRHGAGPEASRLPSGRRRAPNYRTARKRRVPAWAWIGGGLVVAALAFFLIRSLQTPATEITAAQAYEKYQAGAFFLDVRTQDEWKEGHITKSVLIPLDELANRLSEVPRDQDIVIVCRSGARSREGAKILQQAGYAQVSCLKGGLLAWAKAGYEIK